MEVVMKGNVTVKVHGMLKQKQLPGNWAVLYDAGGKNHSPACIELYEKKNAKSPVHTITLENLKFSDKSYQHNEASFLLSIKKEKHHFQFDSVDEKEDWVQSLCHVSQELWKQRARAKESSEAEESEISEDMSENLLYDSCDRVHQFKVSINPNKASEANNLKGHYILNPTKYSLSLLEINTLKSVHDWPYRQIRKFGCTRKLFKMEVGRRCTTGEGEFEFFTPDGSTLAELIKVFTQQTFSQESRQHQVLKPVSSAPPGDGDYVQTLTPSVEASDPLAPQASVAPVTLRTSQSTTDCRLMDSKSSQKELNCSVDSKRDLPKPAPRSSINKQKKGNNTVNVTSEAVHPSSDTKIYETSGGLTAPLNSQLKDELRSKLNAQDPSQGPHAEIENDPASDTVEDSSALHGATSSESFKEKKKNEKEKKKQEKELKAADAKRKKQEEKEKREREKELKEQQIREAKEEKERQKKLKKESKAHEKLKSKKSLDVPAPEPVRFSDGNIYDEPGDLLQSDKPASSLPADPSYCDADDIASVLPKRPISSKSEAEAFDTYATPQKPKKDSWTTHGRPESEHIHRENYNSIKQIYQTQSKSQRPPIPVSLPASQSVQGADDVEDTYNRLGDFQPSVPQSENIYGMASAKQTVETYRAAPTPVAAIAGENEYEEAGTVCPGLCLKQEGQGVRDEYEEAEVQQRAAIRISVPVEGEYADVS